MSNSSNELKSYDKPPVAGQFDLGREAESAAEAESHERELEISTEPTEQELAADRERELDGEPDADVEAEAASNFWPADDKDSPEYAHLTAIAAAASFDLTPADIDALIAANRFKPEGQGNVVALAIRGCVLQEPHEQEKKDSIGVKEVRPNHVDFRCVLGFYFRDLKKLTLFTGSTVPAPFYMKSYLRRLNGASRPGDSRSGCNMMPTGCYVSRVGSHDGGNIKPALRTTNPDNMRDDAIVTVIRTEDDLTFGFGAKDRWDKTQPFDNVHCAYFTSFDQRHEASFSSAGCLTVRGRKDPSHQWEKFQREMKALGQGKRCDLVLLTGREYAIAAKLRTEGLLGDMAAVRKELVRLRVGSQGEEVRRVQEKLAMPQPTGYFGADTKKLLADHQKAQGIPTDGIYSPALDERLGWGAFEAVPAV